MNDRIPGLTYDNPIWYKGWRIYLDAYGSPYQFAYCHDDFDGAEDANDSRYGYTHTEAEAKREIDAWIEEHEE